MDNKVNGWTQEQYEERDRVMRENSSFPLMGSRPGVGYFGSREMLADICASTLYEHRKSLARIEADILIEMYEDDI